MEGVVAPFDHRLFVGEEDVSVTLFPEQKVVGPPAVMEGTAGIVLTATTVAVDVAEVQGPFVTVTV
jgi:hypothetical protein